MSGMSGLLVLTTVGDKFFLTGGIENRQQVSAKVIGRWERKLGESGRENGGRLGTKITNKYANPQSDNTYIQMYNRKCTKDAHGTQYTRTNTQIH